MQRHARQTAYYLIVLQLAELCIFVAVANLDLDWVNMKLKDYAPREKVMHNLSNLVMLSNQET